MKKQIIGILAFVFLFAYAGTAFGQTKETIKEEKIKVGFHCPNGKALIEKELIKSTGVKEVFADLDTKIVTVKFVEGQTNKDELVKAIEKIGYTTEFTKPGTPINKACSHD
ncbi:MAG: heavy-metal-associated domain-containing protein [Bacteroidales bacterium]|jgi:copper chaperone CopZ|nr:heavy-metal-associated domain-containing protein [Bacteroidales bacterium]MDD4214560.1 heavy-metal-associated domain-containing protein [Bacteroidales bacterium]